MSERRFSDEAKTWLSNYHGSLDSISVLLAFEAGLNAGRLEAVETFEVACRGGEPDIDEVADFVRRHLTLPRPLFAEQTFGTPSAFDDHISAGGTLAEWNEKQP